MCMSVYGFCSKAPHTMKSLRLSARVTFQEISTDVGVGAPAVKMEQQGGSGWGETSRRERERVLDVPYQTWRDLQLYGLWRRTLISSPFAFFSLHALLLSVIE